MTEAWYRNPDAYIRELVETGESNIAWDRGRLVKRKIDPIKHADLYFGKSYPWRALAIGEQGTAEYRTGDTLYRPTAVYPTWIYGEDQGLLEEIIEQPVGEDEDICNDNSIQGDERPVFGQEHRVVITDLPPGSSGPGRKFLAYLKELQEDNPNCIIHLHGPYSYRIAFGMDFGAADIDPRINASKGKITLPIGKEILYERAVMYSSWVTMLGFKPVDLEVPRNRCMFNIKAAAWAGKYYNQEIKTPRKDLGRAVDHLSPDKDYEPIEKKSHLSKHMPKKPGDQFACDTCSLQLECSYFRLGAVCSVPGAEPKALSSFFKTRDSNTIIEGLGTLVAANANRLERGMEEERILGDVNPEVTKMIGQVFDQGQKLAKLVDPNLRGGAKVQVNVGGNAAVVSAASPRQMVASVIRELEDQGFKREDITPEMVQNLIAGMADPEQSRRTIEAAPKIVEHRDL